jgi:hypothetical protein
VKKNLLIKSILIASALPFLAGCVQQTAYYHERPVYVQTTTTTRVTTVSTSSAPAPMPAPGPATVVVTDPSAPPPPQVEVVTVAPGPVTQYYWVPGVWEWRGTWVWAGGHWIVRPYYGAVWVQSGWVYRHHNRVWVTGHWR